MRFAAWPLLVLGLLLTLVSGLLLITRRQPISSAWIWFVSIEDGEIYRMWADGSHRQQITDSPGRKMQLAPSPDGERLAFVSDHDGNDEIYLMQGDEVQRLTYVPDFDGNPSWSPDGEWLAFYSGRDGNAEIYRMRADGSNPQRLTNRTGFDGQPVWWPDGEWIGYMANVEANNDLYRIPAGGGDPQRLTVFPDYDGSLDVSPDGEWLIFTSDTGGGDFHILKMREDGSQLTALTEATTYQGFRDARWSPNGEWITFWGSLGDEFQIFRVRPDGSDLTALTEAGPYLAPVPARITELGWRGGLVFLLGVVVMLLGLVYSTTRKPHDF